MDPDDIKSGLIWILTVLHYYGIPKEVFEIVDFDPNQQKTNKHAKLPSIQIVKDISIK